MDVYLVTDHVEQRLCPFCSVVDGKNDHRVFPSPCVCPLHLTFVAPTVKERESSSHPWSLCLAVDLESRLENAGGLPSCCSQPLRGHWVTGEGCAPSSGPETAKGGGVLSQLRPSQVRPSDQRSDAGQPRWTRSSELELAHTRRASQEALRVI